jgi:hypothetical protein
MMRHLAGNAQMSFEGSQKGWDFPITIKHISEDESPLRPCSAYREFPFVILALEADTIKLILDTILPNNRFMNDVIQIQIAKNGKIEFGCYDNFHPDCILAYSGVSTDFLNRLLSRRIIKSWEKAPDEAARPHN